MFFEPFVWHDYRLKNLPMVLQRFLNVFGLATI